METVISDKEVDAPRNDHTTFNNVSVVHRTRHAALIASIMVNMTVHSNYAHLCNLWEWIEIGQKVNVNVRMTSAETDRQKQINFR